MLVPTQRPDMIVGTDVLLISKVQSLLPQLSWLEREAVNLKVAGSSPAGSAVSQACLPTEWGLFATWTRQAAITSVRRCHAKDDDANEWE